MKLSFDDWVTSMSFMIDDDFDLNFLGSIDDLTQLINQESQNFNNSHGLNNFLTTGRGTDFSNELRLKVLVSLIGFSEERLKRVVSLVRSNFRGERFNSEWSVKQISNKLLTDHSLKELLINFFINGRNSKIGRSVPLYYLRNFRLLESSFIHNLEDADYVKRVLNDNEIQGKYSNRVGDLVEKEIIIERIKYFSQAKGESILFEMQKEFPLLNKNIDILIPNLTKPKILIESSYNITTGSGQSKRADQLVEIYTQLMRHNANHSNNKIYMVNYCDGLGWTGRQRDLKRIYDSSDFVLNRENLTLIDRILEEFYF